MEDYTIVPLPKDLNRELKVEAVNQNKSKKALLEEIVREYVTRAKGS